MVELSATARLEAVALDAQHEMTALTAIAGGDGAIVTFVGLARDGRDGQPVSSLFLEHHDVLTERSLRDISDSAFHRFDVSHVHVVHRYGSIAPGEPIVFAGATARHRRAAFDAVNYLMDRLKTDAAFWKREEGPAGRCWIEPTDEDHHARARWSE